MKWIPWIAVSVLSAGLNCGYARAQGQAPPSGGDAAPPSAALADAGPVALEWTPPALEQLRAGAAVKSDFTLDRTMLGAAAALMGTSGADLQPTIRKLDGVSVHILGFGQNTMADPALVQQIRDAYHLRGWKHLVSTTAAGGPIHDGRTDVWLVLDGTNVRGAVVLADTPRSVVLVTLAGNLSPADLLHLRGHFGIPRFAGDGFKDAEQQ